MIVTVTPTVMDGTVVRWYRDMTLDAIPGAEPIASASRNGVCIGTFLHLVPAEVLAAAQETYETLSRDGRADVRHLATHRRRGLFGPLEPVDTTEAQAAGGGGR